MARIRELTLDLANLASLDDGKVNRLLRFHLQRIAQDLMARPGEPSARKLTLQISFKPIASQEGECESAHCEIEAKSSIPIYRTKPYQMRVANGGMSFNQDFPDSIDQPSLYADGEDDGDQDHGD